MIVLDTNALRGGAYGPATSATLLRGLAAETGHQLALPQEVVAECLANYERQIAPLIDAGDGERLFDVVPSWLGRSASAGGARDAALPSATSAINELRQSLTERPSTRFVVLDTPAGAADEGIARERSRRPPATERGHEARDVVVWLTTLEAAKAQRPSNVYFVSGDKTFSGDDPRHLKAELRDEGPPNLRFFPSIDALVDRLSCVAEPADGVSGLPAVLHSIEQTALHGASDPNHDLRRDLWEWAPEGVRSSDLIGASPSLVSERAVRSRRCGDRRFTAIDAIYRLDLRYRSEEIATVPVSARLGILVTDDDDEVVSVRVLARSGIRPHGTNGHVEESNGTE